MDFPGLHANHRSKDPNAGNAGGNAKPVTSFMLKVSESREDLFPGYWRKKNNQEGKFREIVNWVIE